MEKSAGFKMIMIGALSAAAAALRGHFTTGELRANTNREKSIRHRAGKAGTVAQAKRAALKKKNRAAHKAHAR